MNETWKIIKNYNDYEASNLGNIRRINSSKNLKFTNYKGRYIVGLYNNKCRKVLAVAKVIAETFIPNPNNYKYVKHKNNNRFDNNIDNLEWYNDAYKISNSDINKRINTNYYRIGVFKLDKNNNITRYKSITEAAKDNNTSISMIIMYLKGKCKSTKGDYYYYEESY